METIRLDEEPVSKTGKGDEPLWVRVLPSPLFGRGSDWKQFGWKPNTGESLSEFESRPLRTDRFSMRYDQLAAQLRAPRLADTSPGGMYAQMAYPADPSEDDTQDDDDQPNDADFGFVNDYISLVQQEIKLCNAILLEGSSDDVAAWALEELMDSTEDLLELKDMLADLEEDKADGGADEGTESSAKVAAKRKASRRMMMKKPPAGY